MFMKIIKMTSEAAEEIIKWQYPSPYHIYNMAGAYDDLMASYYAVYQEDLIAYFCLGKEAQVPPGDYRQPCLDIGLGLKPDLCGRGLGQVVLREIEGFAARSWTGDFRLTVATFNERAIRVYQALAYDKGPVFKRQDRDFMIMIKERTHV